MAKAKKADGSRNWQDYNSLVELERAGDPRPEGNKRKQTRSSRILPAEVGESDYLWLLGDESCARLEALRQKAREFEVLEGETDGSTTD